MPPPRPNETKAVLKTSDRQDALLPQLREIQRQPVMLSVDASAIPDGNLNDFPGPCRFNYLTDLPCAEANLAPVCRE